MTAVDVARRPTWQAAVAGRRLSLLALSTPLPGLTLVARASYTPVEPPEPVFDPAPGTLWETNGGGVPVLWACERWNGEMILRNFSGETCRPADLARLCPAQVVPVDAEALEKVFECADKLSARGMPCSLLELVLALRAIPEQK